MGAFFTLGVANGAYAQFGGEGLPDLSGIAGAISTTVAPKPSGTFSSGLRVPSVNPGATAKGIGRRLREKTEAASGQKQPALQRLEDGMPKALAMLEGQLQAADFAKRDLGVAVGYFFVTNYETALGRKVSVAASGAAGRRGAPSRRRWLKSGAPSSRRWPPPSRRRSTKSS